MVAKGSKLSDEHRRKLSESHKGQFSPTLKHGRRSKLLKELQPIGCQECEIKQCPFRVESGNSICSMQERWVALGTVLGDVYERDDLANFMASVLKVQAWRFSKAVFQEALEGMGLDPEVTKLGRALVQDGSKLAEVKGHIRSGPQVVVDQRQLHVHNEMRQQLESLPESEYLEVLQAYSHMREVNEKVTLRLMAGETIDDLIDEQIQDEREKELARTTKED